MLRANTSRNSALPPTPPRRPPNASRLGPRRPETSLLSWSRAGACGRLQEECGAVITVRRHTGFFRGNRTTVAAPGAQNDQNVPLPDAEVSNEAACFCPGRHLSVRRHVDFWLRPRSGPPAQGFARLTLPTLPTPARPWRSRPARSRPPRRSPSRCRTRPPTHRPAAPAATLARRRHCSRDPARGSRIGSEPLSGKRRRAAPPQRNMG